MNLDKKESFESHLNCIIINKYKKFEIISIILINTYFLFANETFKSIEELCPNVKQIKQICF